MGLCVISSADFANLILILTHICRRQQSNQFLICHKNFIQHSEMVRANNFELNYLFEAIIVSMISDQRSYLPSTAELITLLCEMRTHSVWTEVRHLSKSK